MKKNEFIILRFAHAFSSGGGMETYINDLDRSILKDNAWTIIRMYLTYDKEEKEPRFEPTGQGHMLNVPLYTIRGKERTYVKSEKNMYAFTKHLKNHFRDYVIFNPFLYKFLFSKIIQNISTPTRINEAIDAGSIADSLMVNHKINLLVMHYIGGRDSASIIEAARRHGVPYVFINHFSNDSLDSLSIREQTIDAAGIAGVSKVGVPERLRKYFVNLSDGIDIDFYRKSSIDSSDYNNDIPVVLQAARVTPEKGQHDLIEACAELHRSGVKVRIALAGRADSKNYVLKLKDLAFRMKIGDQLLFLNELNSKQLKLWYEKTSIFAFPTYHNEGLGRVLLESQAMKVPPISYIVGGTSDAIINGKTGYLIKKGDKKSFISKIHELLIDEQKRQKMGNAGRNHIVKEFSLQSLASRHIKFYKKHSIIQSTK